VRLCNSGHARWACAKRQAAEAPSTEETRKEGVGLAWLSARGFSDEACRYAARPGIAAQQPVGGGSGVARKRSATTQKRALRALKWQSEDWGKVVRVDGWAPRGGE
jgi:hypothetical protein